MAVEVVFVGLYRLDGDIVGCFIDFHKTNVAGSLGYDDHLDVIDSIGLCVVAADGVTLGAVSVADATTILLGRRVDTPVAGDSLCVKKKRKRKKKTKQMGRYIDKPFENSQRENEELAVHVPDKRR